MKSYLLPLLLCFIDGSAAARDVAPKAPRVPAPKAANRPAASAEIRFESPREAAAWVTASGTSHRLSAAETLKFAELAQPLETQAAVYVDPTKRFQTVLGIGGAITDAAAEVFDALPETRQRELLDAFYDPDKGIGYTLARTNIHSCDFSSGSYTYVADGDKELKTFSVAHDLAHRIPLIKRALAAARGRLTVYASPWSPPAWMKDNGDMLHGGKLKPEFRQSWAEYYAKFIRAYEHEGVPIWGVTVQNEPMATQTWESSIFTAEEERDFLRDHLGPTLAKAGLGDRKIMVWDHNRDLLYHRVSTILSDPVAAKYAWGIAYHWYENWQGGDQQFDNIARVHEAFPDKPLFFTESTAMAFKDTKLDNWALGEMYGRAMIKDFNSGAVAWTDWNFLLDMMGGPNHVGNFCTASAHADTKTGAVVYTNIYHYIGHFSKFVRPGARRVTSVASRDHLLTSAFLNMDGSLAIVVMNSSDKETPFLLWMQGRAAQTTSPAHSIATYVVR